MQTVDSPFIKKYKTKYLAEKAAKSIVDKCTYIQDWQAGNKFTLEALRATREKFDKVAELVAQRLTVDENGEFILRELTTEEFEEIEKALYKEGSRKVIATLEGD